jgi:hypothetical protein
MNTPITPGEILLEEFFKPMGISQDAMARAFGVALCAFNQIVHGRVRLRLPCLFVSLPSSASRMSSGPGSRLKPPF